MYKLKYLILLLSLVFTGLSCGRTTFRIVEPTQQLREEDASADFAEEIMLSLLAVRRNMNTGIIGSGILVEINGLPHMMTALHVIDHMIREDRPYKDTACHIDVYTGEEDCADIYLGPGFERMVRVDRSVDAALVPLSHYPEGAQPVDLATPGHRFRIGEELWIVGCPTGAPNIVTRGILSGYADGVGGRFAGALFTDSDVWFGTSGGGVFLANGEYVGCIRAMVGSRTPSGREIAEGLNIFSPLPEGWRLLSR